MSEIKDTNRIVSKAINAGAVSPFIPNVTSVGFAYAQNHNTMVEALRQGLESVFILKDEVEREYHQHLQSVREREIWLEERREEIQDRTERSYNSEIKYPEVAALPVLSETVQTYLSKVEEETWGHLIKKEGPWSLVGRVDDCPFGFTSAIRYRVYYDSNVTISEVFFGSSPESLSIYNVKEGYVETEVDSQTTVVSGFPMSYGEVFVVVKSGPSKGSKFIADLAGSTLSNIPCELKVGDNLEIGIKCECIDIGIGRYEVEYLRNPIRTRCLDVVVGSNQEEAWLGLPRFDSTLKIYAPVAEIRSFPGIEPSSPVTLRTNEIIPDGSGIAYYVESQGKLFEIDKGEVFDIRSQIPVKQVQEKLVPSRFGEIELSWSPYIEEGKLEEYRYGFDPNISGGKSVQTFYGSFGNTTDTYIDQLSKWNAIGVSSSDLEGGAYIWDGRDFVSGEIVPTANKLVLETLEAINLRTEYGQPFGTKYSWVCSQSTFTASAPSMSIGLFQDPHWEFKVRTNHSGEGVSVRYYGPTKGDLGLGLYYRSVDGTLTTIDSNRLNTDLNQQFLFNLEFEKEILRVTVVSQTGLTINALSGSLTSIPNGPGVSFEIGSADELITHLSSVDVRSVLPNLAPIRLSVIDNTGRIGPDRTGQGLIEFSPRYETIRVSEDPTFPGVYRLQYPPLRRLYESGRSGEDELPVKVVEWIESDQLEGDVIEDFEIDVKSQTLRIRDQKRRGTIQISYWTMGQSVADVPITRNISDYIAGQRRVLRSPNFNVENRDYYPIVEYLHMGKKIQVSGVWESVEVEYDSYATHLGLLTRFSRGYNPCRSPRINRAYWEAS